MNNTAKWVVGIALSVVMLLFVLDAVITPSRVSLGTVAFMVTMLIISFAAWHLKANRVVKGVLIVVAVLSFLLIRVILTGVYGLPGGAGSPLSPVTTPTPAKGGSTIPLTRATIPEVGYIGLPDNMTVEPFYGDPGALRAAYQSLGVGPNIDVREVRRRFQESVLQDLGFDPSILQSVNLIATQKGLERYARIIVETIPGNPGEYARLSAKYTLTQRKMKELEKETRSAAEAEFKDTPFRILEWHPARLEDVNGMRAITVSYSRQLRDSPPVLVQRHLFQNYDRVILLTTTYRLQERPIWEAALQQSIASFVITNIR